jgi:hypothetical protein
MAMIKIMMQWLWERSQNRPGFWHRFWLGFFIAGIGLTAIRHFLG